MSDPQSGGTQEVLRQVRLSAHTGTPAPQRWAEPIEIRYADVGEFALLDVAPDKLDRIQKGGRSTTDEEPADCQSAASPA
jgi:hypothetical protein